MELRQYQQDAITALRRSLGSGHSRPVMVAPTGSGKTVLAAEIVRMALDKGSRVLFLAPRRELIYQASAKFEKFGIPHGVIMAGEPMNIYRPVQVASFDTLHSRKDRMPLPSADLLIVDEAHLSVAPTRRKLIEMFPGAKVIGLTATPARGDGRGLGEIYDDLVESWDIRRLTAAGYLVPVRYFAPSKPDLEGLKLNRDGDYVEKYLGERVDQPQLVGDIVHNWFRIASNLKTVVFCVTRSHSRHVCGEFKQRGIRAEHLDGDTPLDERRAILARVESGETQVLCNVFVATFGLDIPSLECAVLARPTRNISLYLQTVGRVLRPCEGKDEAVVIDHAGAVDEHGFVSDQIPWSLDSETTVKERKRKQQQERAEPKELTCGDCGTVFKARRSCPHCGLEIVPAGKPVPVHQADLQEMSRNNRKDTWEQKAAFYGGLLSYAAQKGYKPGWAAHAYLQKYGVWPNDKRVRGAGLVEPSEEVRGWIKHLAIRRAKSRSAA